MKNVKAFKLPATRHFARYRNVVTGTIMEIEHCIAFGRTMLDDQSGMLGNAVTILEYYNIARLCIAQIGTNILSISFCVRL